MMILAIVQYDEHKHYHYGCCFNCQGHLCCISCLKLVLGISVNIINIIITIVIQVFELKSSKMDPKMVKNEAKMVQNGSQRGTWRVDIGT